MLDLEQIIAIQRKDVLRWNRQFNLISRSDPQNEVEDLLDESKQSFRRLESYLVDLRRLDPEFAKLPILYIDLGSGGGFPGLIWNHMFSSSPDLSADYQGGHLVEPREKRAWFLEQCARRQEQRNLYVHEARWGNSSISLPKSRKPRLVLISLKALNLDDAEIVEGLSAVQAGPGYDDSILILRFVAHDSDCGTLERLDLQSRSGGSALSVSRPPLI